jgi:hypothetical protein
MRLKAFNCFSRLIVIDGPQGEALRALFGSIAIWVVDQGCAAFGLEPPGKSVVRTLPCHSLIRRRRRCPHDNQPIRRVGTRLQFQAELLLERREDRNTACIR